MGKASKSIERMQDIVLGQFKRDLMSDRSNTVVTRAIDDGVKATNERNKRQYERESKGNCVGGFTVEGLASGERAMELQAIKHSENIKSQAQNRDRHSVLNSVLDIFGEDFFYNEIITAELLEEFQGIEEKIVESELINIKLIIDKPLSKSIRCFVEYDWMKPIFVKGPNFANDKSDVVRTYTPLADKEKFTVSYGDVLNFRKELLKPISTLLKRFNVADEGNKTNDIWKFEF